MNVFRTFRPALMAPEGLDTSSFFGDQALVDESKLPDASVAGDAPDNVTQEEPPKQQQPQPTQEQPETDEVIEHDAGDGKRKQFVPLVALQKERASRQEQQQQNAQLLERLTKIMETQQAQQQQAKQEEPPKVEIPAFVDDPEGHIEGLKKQFQMELDQLRQGNAQVTQQQQAQQQLQQLAANVTQHETVYRQANPDYDQALEFFNQRKTAEYMALGLDAAAAGQQLARDYQGLAIRAQQMNANPAQMLHNLAKALGFTAQPAPNGQPPKKAPTSLSDVNGTTRAPDQRGTVTAKDIANMSNEDFDKFFNEMAAAGNSNRPAF